MFHVKHSFHHDNRGVLLIQGEDRHTFLQGLITNDINQLSDQRLLYSALLTPQGKFLFDFFIHDNNEALFLDCLAETKESLLKKLNLYKLRARVTFQDVSESYSIYTIHGHSSLPSFFVDPRCSKLGYRAFIKRGDEGCMLKDIPVMPTLDSYEQLRLSLGIPQASKDMIPEKSIPLECGLDQLNAISWNKGCYVGQELTARTHYRGVLRKRLLPVQIKGSLPPIVNPIVFQEDQEVGTLYSHNHQIGIARLKIEDIQSSLEGSTPLTCGDAQLIPYIPEWMSLE